MNSTAFCHDSARGADDSISGLVALLAAADTLSGVAPGNLPTRRIVFAAFQGEAYGAIGSRKRIDNVWYSYRYFLLSMYGIVIDIFFIRSHD